jgi:hypothetical protein
MLVENGEISWIFKVKFIISIWMNYQLECQRDPQKDYGCCTCKDRIKVIELYLKSFTTLAKYGI